MKRRPDTSSFDPFHIEMADFARALAHPARIAIIGVLREKPEASCGEIVERLPLAQATVSQHLKVLREAGVIAWREDGPTVWYRLECERVRRFCQAFQLCLGTASDHNGQPTLKPLT